MEKMANSEIHSINLELLKHIDAFCREKNIDYFLDCGTLLGAARNGGFIPWDDDADVVMPRPDYERFVKEYVDTGDYRLYEPSRRNSFLPYARLCEMRRTFFKQVNPWTLESPGVGVDIFPLGGAPDSSEEFDALVGRMVKIRDRLWTLRGILQGGKRFAFRTSPWGFLKDCVHYANYISRSFFPVRQIWRNIAKFRRLRLLHPYETSDKCFYIVVSSDRRKLWQKKWFEDKVYLDLCGEKFPAPAGYDERLIAEYGDWRTPPPESERKGHETAQTMYWRDK